MANNYFGLTDTGKVRGNNEDAFIVQPTHRGDYILAAAIDGVGGYSGGEIAAALARESIIDYFSRSGGDLQSMMVGALLNANEKIYQEKVEVKEHESMACVLTLAVVDLANNEFHYIHVGDTRLYLLRDGSLIKITRDQSFVGYLEDSGRLTEEAAMGHPKRNEINKALGFSTGLESDADYFESGSSPFLPGDMILLCSDGLTDLVNKQDITDVLSGDTDIEVMAQELVDRANAKGGKDNITVVLVKNDRPYQQQEAVKPATVSKKKDLTSDKAVPESADQPESDVSAEPPAVSSKRNGSWTAVLAILCLALAIALIYVLFFRHPVVSTGESKPLPVDTARSSSELLFYQVLNSQKGDTLILNDSVFREGIILREPVELTRDSLYILSRGKIVFKPDSLYSGPAFRIPAGAKRLVLEGMILEGFAVGIESQSRNLKLAGVQFLNCDVPLRYEFSNTKDKFMNGSLQDILLQADTSTQAASDNL
jgi:serine/threonine protein phosphatase PrpC